MLKTQITPAVLDILKQQLRDFDPRSFAPDAPISNWGADSLDTVELVMAIEDEFDIEIDDEKAEQLGNDPTIEQLLTFVHGLVATDA